MSTPFAQKPYRLALLAGMVCALTLLLACGPSPYAPPPPSADLGSPLEVKARAGGDGLSFGDYQVHGIQGERPVQGDWAFVGMPGLTMRQAVSFVFSGGGGGQWYCRCALGDDQQGRDLNIGTLWGYGFSLNPNQSTVLACVMSPHQGGKTWRMSIYSLPSTWREAGKDPNAAGALSDGVSLTIRIAGQGLMAAGTVGGGPPPVYRFLGDSGELAQVRVTGARQVWLSQGSLREPLAVAAGAVLVGHLGGSKK